MASHWRVNISMSVFQSLFAEASQEPLPLSPSLSEPSRPAAASLCSYFGSSLLWILSLLCRGLLFWWIPPVMQERNLRKDPPIAQLSRVILSLKNSSTGVFPPSRYTFIFTAGHKVPHPPSTLPGVTAVSIDSFPVCCSLLRSNSWR